MTTTNVSKKMVTLRPIPFWLILFLIGVFVFGPIIYISWQDAQADNLNRKIMAVQATGATVTENDIPLVMEGRKARYLEESEISLPLGDATLHTRCGKAGSEAYAIKNDQGRQKFILFSSMIPCKFFSDHKDLWREILRIFKTSKDLPPWLQPYVGNPNLIRVITDIIAGLGR